MPTTDELQAQIDALTQRMTALDGVGASKPSLAAVPTLQAKARGFQADLNQLALSMESIRADMNARIAVWVNTIRTMLGV